MWASASIEPLASSSGDTPSQNSAVQPVGLAESTPASSSNTALPQASIDDRAVQPVQDVAGRCWQPQRSPWAAQAAPPLAVVGSPQAYSMTPQPKSLPLAAPPAPPLPLGSPPWPTPAGSTLTELDPPLLPEDFTTYTLWEGLEVKVVISRTNEAPRFDARDRLVIDATLELKDLFGHFMNESGIPCKHDGRAAFSFLLSALAANRECVACVVGFLLLIECARREGFPRVYLHVHCTHGRHRSNAYAHVLAAVGAWMGARIKIALVDEPPPARSRLCGCFGCRGRLRVEEDHWRGLLSMIIAVAAEYKRVRAGRVSEYENAFLIYLIEFLDHDVGIVALAS